VENGQAQYRESGTRGEKEHKGERWRRTIATKDSILAENGRRNNAESIEVGLATPLASRRSSVVRATQSNAKLNSLYFPERRISKSSLVSRSPALPRHARDLPRRLPVHSARADSIFLFSTASPCLLSFYSLELERPRRIECEPSEGCEELLTFHREHCGFSERALPAAAFASLYLSHPFLPFDN